MGLRSFGTTTTTRQLWRYAAVVQNISTREVMELRAGIVSAYDLLGLPETGADHSARSDGHARIKLFLLGQKGFELGEDQLQVQIVSDRTPPDLGHVNAWSRDSLGQYRTGPSESVGR
eukprot:3535644-Rhodomonas_salina.3